LLGGGLVVMSIFLLSEFLAKLCLSISHVFFFIFFFIPWSRQGRQLGLIGLGRSRLGLLPEIS